MAARRPGHGGRPSKTRPRILGCITFLSGLAVCRPALAATPGTEAAAHLAPAWGLPFLGVLLSVALFPIVAPRLWHRRMGLVLAGWVIALVIPDMALHGPAVALAEVWHAVLLEYLPFVILLLALFTTGGGVLISGGPWGRPAGNTLLLAIGTLLAGVMGTTGAAMILIHPLLRANAARRRRRHLAIFLIMLVGNIGGALSPLGDPPLYVGFLRGVPFFWPTVNLALPVATIAGLFLIVFYLLDRRLFAEEAAPLPPPRAPLRVRGWVNVALLGVVIATVLGMGLWHPGAVTLAGQRIGAERLAGMAMMLAVTLASVAATPRAVRQGNLFTWAPMTEVATLFLAVFITIGPVIALLHAGLDGPAAPLLRLIQGPDGHPAPLPMFWLSGGLAAFLDNAPSYLVFFELAGGDPAVLTGTLAPVLRALACATVFFGGLTYIGNAPNLMVTSIASHRGVRMPGFFGYMLWSCALLLPSLAAIGLLFFR
ncbi:sodium:proton antiporter [Acidisphaera rubrifaciens]|nr:sodium:proton antiporter [Acidisphaera rubrifaciens]